MRKHLQTLEVPHYLLKIQLSKKRRAKYWKKTKKKWKPRKISKTLQAKLDSGEYTVNKKGYMLDENKDKVVANPIAVGTPKWLTLSGNQFYSGFGSHFIRNKATTELKKFYKDYVKQLDPFTYEQLPLSIEWDLYTTLGEANWDLDNLGFYWKYLQDTLVKEGKISDDNVKFITSPPGPTFYPVDTDEERKFVIRFYSDHRPEILNLKEKGLICQ